MLYPKKEKVWSDEEFKNPSSEYRAAPFWAWNTKLEKDELLRQIEIFKEMGFGGFHMHVRTGMATEYLSDEYMELICACAEKARNEKMLPWLYDEDRWPSGAAGGYVTKNKAYRQRHLVLTRNPRESVPDERKFIGCFDIVLDGEGSLLAYKQIAENEKEHGFKLFVYMEISKSSPWYNYQTYSDTLNPKAIKEFIHITYERYAGRLEKDFGKLIPAIFTDEPQFSRKGTLRFALEEQDITLPWTDDLPDSFSAAYNGAGLVSVLPELIWDLPGEKISLARYQYHDHIAERFALAFADQCGSWCKDHNLLLTGHLMDEPYLEGQTHALGEAMRSYRSFGLPGIDMLCDQREFTTAKQAQSAARQYGYPGVLSELYGVTNWDFDFRGHKLQGDWQAALGVSVRVPHLSWVSMNGEAKRDYPGTFNYQAPWHKEYSFLENHFARLAYALTRGNAICRIAVIHPIESYWLHWGPRDKTGAVRSVMEENFQNLCSQLLRGFFDFDYICESTLSDQCSIAELNKNTEGNSGLYGNGDIIKFPVGKMNYDAVIVPAMETIRTSTLERLELFSKLGGKLIFLGPPPSLTDAVPDERGKKLWEKNCCIGFDRYALFRILEEFREVSIRNSSGSVSRDFLYQLREEKNDSRINLRWLFICHADREQNMDVPYGDNYQINIRGEWDVFEYNTIAGDINSIGAEISGGWTLINVFLWDHDSLLLKLSPHTKEVQKNTPVQKIESTLRSSSTEYIREVPVSLHEPNVLLLDIAEYALDGESWRKPEEILKLDNILRRELNWPCRENDVVQPWVEKDTSTPHTLRLRFSFDSELDIKDAGLALENAPNTKVLLNDIDACAVDGWYVDKCIGKKKLPDIKKGKNILELTVPYGRKTNVEACFILGNFGVKVQGINCSLTAPVEFLAFGDITRQGLPFYGGNLTYHLETDCKPAANATTASLIIEASSYRFMLLKIAADGKDHGVMAFAPYRKKIDGLSAGIHKIDLTAFGSRINTFGQLHNNQRGDRFWWGPNSWRSEGTAWTYEYRFWPQGILKSPEFFFS